MGYYRPGGFQATLARAAEYCGPGLHCGKYVNMRILPAPPGTGIRFMRADIPGSPVIPARPENVVSSARCTSIGSGEGARVDTIEHLMAAFRGLGVDNAIVELDGPEVPMGDGSAAAFVELICQAGRIIQDEERLSLVLDSPIWVSEGDKHLIALPLGTMPHLDTNGSLVPGDRGAGGGPGEGLRVTFTFVGNHPAVGTQHVEFELDGEGDDGGVFVRELAPARTIGFVWEIEKLREAGLALGGNLESAVVIGQEGYLGPLRFENEVARHKVLDIVGDFALLGHVCAHIIGIKSNHAMNHMAIRAIAESASYIDPVHPVHYAL
ncbi:MAG TPA: UDP-3-O-acyl-N-acetylglucosamine deacetylase [Firmicutes bacterium]|nr:UDP-3-O-acyl-N-acetylglucosamine deacetylase [Bacillota bacterium]